MKQKGTVLLALFCGVVCACSVFVYTSQVQAHAEAQRSEALERYGGDQIEVCVATRDIAVGEVVDAASTTSRLWLVDLLPQDPITDLSDVAGMHAASSILAGEVLSHARFEGVESSVPVPAGMQAVGVELASAQAVSGALEAGSLVDVYAAGASSTACIAENVLVAAIAEQSSGRYSVTLAVAPEQVEEVIASTQSTSLYLTLPARGEGRMNTHQDASDEPENEDSLEVKEINEEGKNND